MTIPRDEPTLIEKLDAICNEIFERWDKDQRSGKLLSALAGRLPTYRKDVSDIRRALIAHADMLTALSTIEEMTDGEIAVRFRTSSCNTEERAAGKSVVYSLLVVPRNIARAAIAKAIDSR